MKVLHLATSDKEGGAAIASYRLNEAMQMNGIKSILLVCKQATTNKSVFKVGRASRKSVDRNYRLKKRFLKSSFVFSFGYWGKSRISQLQELKDADVIYIHWINNFLTIKEIHRILSLGKPVILFMHDMWALTGGCHYALDCNKYHSLCSECPYINNRYLKNVVRCVFKRKQKYWGPHKNLFIAAASSWLSDCARNSALFKNNIIRTVPNLLNTSLYKPCGKDTARNILTLPLNKKLILFGASGGSSNPYKGWNYMLEALRKLDIADIEVIVFGNELSAKDKNEIPFPTHSMGALVDEYTLVLLYNAVDVFVSPSLAEAFGQTIFESQACGTLAVGFNVGGIPDLIKHKQTGYLANYKDCDDLAAGIEWALSNKSNKEIIDGMREHIIRNFSYDVVVEKHLNFYSQIVNLDKR
nr:glycosyltransferase [uncultured Bacteroides sp.]